jgi:subtilisin family serine protease
MDSGLRTIDGAGEVPEHAVLESCFMHQPWLLRPEEREVDDEDETDVDQTGTLDFQAGHGTFIAGIIRQHCPDAEVYTCGVLTSFGEGSVSGVLHALRRVLALIGPIDVAVMSFGGYFENDDATGLGRELKKLLGDAVAVGSAGNDASCRPYFPAALPDVIGVGGLATDGRAWFSNYGPWVDACAPAVDVVSTFFNDFTERLDAEALRHFDGWARWSGTSFAAPKVAALIAQERYLHGGTPREVWRRLTSHRHLRHADLGTVFNV